jgi:hypothetical protein
VGLFDYVDVDGDATNNTVHGGDVFTVRGAAELSADLGTIDPAALETFQYEFDQLDVLNPDIDDDGQEDFTLAVLTANVIALAKDVVRGNRTVFGLDLSAALDAVTVPLTDSPLGESLGLRDTLRELVDGDSDSGDLFEVLHTADFSLFHTILNQGLSDDVAAATSQININMAGSGSNPMSPEETAGAPEVNDDHWNNLSGDSNNGGPIDLFDGEGNLISGATVSYTTTGRGSSVNDGVGTNNGHFFSSNFDARNYPDITVSVSGIPYSQYDVYAYHQGGATSSRVARFNIGETDLFARRPTDYGYTRSTATQDEGANTQSGTYVVFEGLSGSSFELTVGGGSASDFVRRARFAGLQIVETGSPVPPDLARFKLNLDEIPLDFIDDALTFDLSTVLPETADVDGRAGIENARLSGDLVFGIDTNTNPLYLLTAGDEATTLGGGFDLFVNAGGEPLGGGLLTLEEAEMRMSPEISLAFANLGGDKLRIGPDLTLLRDTEVTLSGHTALNLRADGASLTPGPFTLAAEDDDPLDELPAVSGTLDVASGAIDAEFRRVSATLDGLVQLIRGAGCRWTGSGRAVVRSRCGGDRGAVGGQPAQRCDRCFDAQWRHARVLTSVADGSPRRDGGGAAAFGRVRRRTGRVHRDWGRAPVRHFAADTGLPRSVRPGATLLWASTVSSTSTLSTCRSTPRFRSVTACSTARSRSRSIWPAPARDCSGRSTSGR